MSLEKKKVLVTGATGFIGGRLAQRLAEDEGAVVTGTGRDLDKVPFLRDAGVQLVQAGLLDLTDMRELVAGQDVVFHVAAWLGNRHGGREMAWPVNVYAVLNLVRGAAAAGVSRFVHVSSIAAYGAPDADVIDESRPVDPTQDATYGRTKAEGELKALRLAQEVELELAVIRPGMVYGPRSYGWSVRMLNLVQKRVPVIFGDGDGYAYPVYVDNLIDGMILAATRPGAAGEAFNIVDPPVTWREWFGFYGDMCGKQPVALPLWLARLVLKTVAYLPLGFSVDRDLAAYYLARNVYPTTKAERLLSYRPRVPIEEGMRRTEQWLRDAGYLDA